MIQSSDIRPLKQHLLDLNFGQGMIVWQGLTPYS